MNADGFSRTSELNTTEKEFDNILYSTPLKKTSTNEDIFSTVEFQLIIFFNNATFKLFASFASKLESDSGIYAFSATI